MIRLFTDPRNLKRRVMRLKQHFSHIRVRGSVSDTEQCFLRAFIAQMEEVIDNQPAHHPVFAEPHALRFLIEAVLSSGCWEVLPGMHPLEPVRTDMMCLLIPEFAPYPSACRLEKLWQIVGERVERYVPPKLVRARVRRTMSPCP